MHKNRKRQKFSSDVTFRERITRSLENRPAIAVSIVVFGAIGALIVVFNNFLSVKAKIKETPTSTTRIAAIINLKDDLNRIRILLPFDQSFSDCLKRRREPFESAVEACARERKLSQADAIEMVDKNLSPLKLLFSQKELGAISEHLQAIRYLAYEMQNNQLALEHWRKIGCSNRIKLLDSKDAEKLPKDQDGNAKCALSVETYSNFLERSAGNQDRVSVIKRGTVGINRIKVFIVPGEEDTIDNYFLKSNNMLYSAALQHIEQITPFLKDLMK